MGLAPRRSGECDPAPSKVVAGRSQPRLHRGQDLPEHPVALTGNKASNNTFSILPFAGVTSHSVTAKQKAEDVLRLSACAPGTNQSLLILTLNVDLVGLISILSSLASQPSAR